MPKARSSYNATSKARFLFPKEQKMVEKNGKYYPAEDVAKPRSRAFKPTAAKLRSNITPGTVLILLAGRFRGRRVVFLKQMPSGLLLVSGPYSVNGVPLRRVNQAYVIATSKKVNVAGVNIPATVTDAMFKAEEEKKKKGEADFMAMKSAAKETSGERKALQAAVDSGIKVDAVEAAYLKSRFSLSKGDKPHAMKF